MKVEFKVNDVKQDYAMKLGDGGEAFFVFESNADIPEDLQTSPLLTPASSPRTRPSTPGTSQGLDSEPLDLTTNGLERNELHSYGASSHDHSTISGLGKPQYVGKTIIMLISIWQTYKALTSGAKIAVIQDRGL